MCVCTPIQETYATVPATTVSHTHKHTHTHTHTHIHTRTNTPNLRQTSTSLYQKHSFMWKRELNKKNCRSKRNNSLFRAKTSLNVKRDLDLCIWRMTCKRYLRHYNRNSSFHRAKTVLNAKRDLHTGWLRLVGSSNLYVSFAKEPYKRDYILQTRPIILKSLLWGGYD